jgi:hypothetical protein
MQSTSTLATICHIGGLKFSGDELNRVFIQVESSAIHPIEWNQMTSSWGLIMDFDTKLPCHMDRLMSGHCLMMENTSQDRLWDWNEESIEDGHYGSQ